MEENGICRPGVWGRKSLGSDSGKGLQVHICKLPEGGSTIEE